MTAARSFLYRHLFIDSRSKPGMSVANKCLAGLILFGGVFAIISTEPDVIAVSPTSFRLVEILLAISFTVEYVVRVYAAGEIAKYQGFLGRLRYIFSPLALVDLIATVPLYFTFLPTDTALLRLCRLISVIRFAKLGRYSRAMYFLSEAVMSRRFELGLSLAIGVFILVITATLLYLAEGTVQTDKFGSIPRALWWSIMTLTTVGYGDVYPVTVIGKFLAGTTAIVGIGLIAMPTGILAAAFSEVFQRHREFADKGRDMGQPHS
jgi:voltage-gated potassium channel